jgi:hypothetical protein
MQGIRARYNTVAVCFYTFYRKFVTHCPTAPYRNYVIRNIFTTFPKLAYQNPFEPAYTRPEVKYNAPVVLTLIAFTLWASRKAVCEEEAKAQKAW